MKDTIIIVEGPQGAGKTTFTNYLREKMSATDLYRLAGIKDKTETGHKKIEKKYMERWLSWLKALDSKSSKVEISSGVRIPFSPL